MIHGSPLALEKMKVFGENKQDETSAINANIFEFRSFFKVSVENEREKLIEGDKVLFQEIPIEDMWLNRGK